MKKDKEKSIEELKNDAKFWECRAWKLEDDKLKLKDAIVAVAMLLAEKNELKNE